MLNKNFKFLFTLYFIIFGIFITALGAFISYKVHIFNINKTIEHYAQEVSYSKLNDYLSPHIEKMNSLVEALANDKLLQSYLATQDSKKLAGLNNLFLTIANSERNIMQVRYIDASGEEIIRVDRDNQQSLPHIIQKEKLQDKSLRDYFISIKKMNTPQIWYSAVDLNIEHKKIEVPYKPTFRIAMPLFKDQKFAGTIIINILVKELFTSINSPIFNIFIIDKDGYYILHPDEKYSWNKYTGVKRTLYQDFPNGASDILAGKTEGNGFFAYKVNHILNNVDNAILILQPKASIEKSMRYENIITSAIVALLSILLSIPLAMYAAAAPSKLQRKLFDSNKELERFRSIIDKYVVTACTDIGGVITSTSAAFCKASGYTKDELIDQKMNIIKNPLMKKSFYHNLWETILKGNNWSGEIQNRTKQGENYWLEQTIIPVKDNNNHISYFMSVGIDITAKKKLETLSIMDKLTNVFNRRKIDESLRLEIQRAERYNKKLSLIIMDIDHFKYINDNFGHQIGDDVLIKVAEILQQSIRKIDVLGRFGGEEFLIICPQTEKEGVIIAAENIRKNIESYEFDTVQHITISLGLTSYQLGDDENTMIKRSDDALYLSKNKGRNKATFL
ncbi:MAG: diguanylate cyclase [Thiovulaceae bacterium]|nr:diguanylate cyclase [Sulfurimonadaceae bacterium]